MAGFAVGEMLGLTVGNVNPLHGWVRVASQVVEVAGIQHTGPPKSAAGRRTVPLPRFVLEELARNLAGKGPGEYVFTAPRGGQVRRTLWAARFWRPATIAAGLQGLRIHDLRHTAVSLWIAAGATPLETAKRAGHGSTARVLDLYGHLAPDAFQATTDRLDSIARSAAQSVSA